MKAVIIALALMTLMAFVACAIDPIDFFYSASDDTTIKTWNLTTGAGADFVRYGDTNNIYSLVLGDGGRTLYSGMHNHNVNPQIHHIISYNATSRSEIMRYNGTKNAHMNIAVTPDYLLCTNWGAIIISELLIRRWISVPMGNSKWDAVSQVQRVKRLYYWIVRRRRFSFYGW
jgi:WD40 repeat protein